MSQVQHTTSSTGADLGPGVVNGIACGGSTAGVVFVRLHNAASTTSGGLLAKIGVPTAGTGYISLGGLQFASNLTVFASAGFGGITVVKQ